MATFSTAKFEDEDAKDLVKCCMWMALHGETPQWEDWRDSLDGCDAVTFDEIAVWEAVGVWNSDADIYINFLILVEDINSISYGLPPCDCPEPMLITQLFSLGEYYGTELTAPTGKAIGQPEAGPLVGAGIYVVETDLYKGKKVDGNGFCANIRITLPPNVLVTYFSCRVLANRVNLATEGDRWCCAWVGDPTSDGTHIWSYEFPAGWYDGSGTTVILSEPEGFTPTPHTHLYIHASIDKGEQEEPPLTGYVAIDMIRILCIPYEP